MPDGPGHAGRARTDGHHGAARRLTRRRRGSRVGRAACRLRRRPAGRRAAVATPDRTQEMERPMSKPSSTATIDRREFVARLLAACPDALVVTGLGSPSYDVF